MSELTFYRTFSGQFHLKVSELSKTRTFFGHFD